MTKLEIEIINELILEYAAMIGLDLSNQDAQTILAIYASQRAPKMNTEKVILDALYAMQEEKTKKSRLVLN